MTLWLHPDPLILASRSAARRALLEAAAIPLELHPADIDERTAEAGAPSPDPAAIAAHLARQKALLVAGSRPGRLVLGADQTMALGDERFSKPSDRDAARAQLKALRGRSHQLHAAVAFARDATILFERSETARLTMRAFSDAFLDRYLAVVGDAVSTSVGGYQLEGPGVQLFEHIEGDYFTILGLPLLPVLEFLRQHQWLEP